jgi:hypothetical protein
VLNRSLRCSRRHQEILELIDPTGDFDFDSDFKIMRPSSRVGNRNGLGLGLGLGFCFVPVRSFVSFFFGKKSFPVLATFTVRPFPGEKRVNPLLILSFSSIRITLLASRHRLDSFVMLSSRLWSKPSRLWGMFKSATNQEFNFQPLWCWSRWRLRTEDGVWSEGPLDLDRNGKGKDGV